jgi:helix-hairpin-helix protein
VSILIATSLATQVVCDSPVVPKRALTPEQQLVLALGRRHVRDLRAAFSYGNSGLSPRTIGLLIAGGIGSPEKLRAADWSDIKAIPGIGRIAAGEIKRYRKQHDIVD